MTSGDISIKSKPTRLTINENGRILKHTRMNAFDSCRAVARALIGGGGGLYIFIYSGSARLVSFEIKLISKEVSRAKPEYMNLHPPPPPN